MPDVQRSTTTIDGRAVAWHHAEPPAGVAPTVYVHGVPTSGADWIPFLERTGGVAPDQAGFGGSDPVAAPTMDTLADALGAFVDDRFPDPATRVNLVVHDWGGLGLIWALRRPERIAHVVVVNAVPLTPGYRWHPMARVWRTRGLGEVSLATPRPLLAALVRRRTPLTRSPVPEALCGEVDRGLSPATRRTILGLYRSADPERLVEAGRGLDAFAGRATVVWGVGDRYIDPRFADAFAGALGTPGAPAPLHRVDGEHWPWVERPDTIDLVTAPLLRGAAG